MRIGGAWVAVWVLGGCASVGPPLPMQRAEQASTAPAPKAWSADGLPLFSTPEEWKNPFSGVRIEQGKEEVASAPRPSFVDPYAGFAPGAEEGASSAAEEPRPPAEEAQARGSAAGRGVAADRAEPEAPREDPEHQRSAE